MKKSLFALIVILLSCPSFSQIQYFDGTIEEAFSYAEKHKQNVFVDVYTDWCHYCKVLDKTTFKDERIIETLNTGYVVLKVNAQSGEGKKFAVNQRVSGYPTLLIMKYDGSTYQRIPGYVKADQLIGVIGQYKTKTQKSVGTGEKALSYILFDTVYYNKNLKESLSKSELESFKMSLMKGSKNDYEWYELDLSGEHQEIMELGFMIGQRNWSKLKKESSQKLLNEYDAIHQFVLFQFILNQQFEKTDSKVVNELNLQENTLLALHTKLCAEVYLEEDYSSTLNKYKKLSKKEKVTLSEFVQRL